MSFKSLLGLLPAVVGAVFSLCSCGSRPMSAEEAELWVAAYAPVHIDVESPIRIELTDLLRSKVDSTRSLNGVFSFSPGIKGCAHYSGGGRYIDFVPSEAMKAGRRYSCRVKLKAIAGVDSLSDFLFDFYVDRREIKFADVVATVDPYDASMMSVSGRVVYNVGAGDSLTASEEIIQCNLPGVKVAMDKSARGFSRGFRISGIKREAKERTLTLAFNPLGGFGGAKREVVIPSIGDFRLLNAERVEAAEPYVNLEFSSPLLVQQELDGLITLDGVSNPRVERSGTNVRVYYGQNGLPDLTLRVSELLKNADGRMLDRDIERHFEQKVIAPRVEIPFKGNILADSRNLKLPFRAVNLAAVDVEVVKIFPSNVMGFLHVNELSDNWNLRRYGRLVYRRTVRLDGDKSLNLHQWQNFSIDLKNLFERERGAIYNIRLTFRRAYSLYGRERAEDFKGVDGVTEADERNWDVQTSHIYRDAPDYNFEAYNWEEIDDPSKPSYYMYEWERMPEVNVVASNLGLIVKRGAPGAVQTVVTDLVSGRPAAGIVVKAYNFQSQPIASGVTDANGFCGLKTENAPYIITATDGRSTTYLKVTDNYELSTEKFDVGGTTLTDGIKGFTYGERGVWRPGDDIHLTLLVEEKNRALPSNHPVVMELYNPNDQLYERQTLSAGVNGFYVFHISTDASVPTGLWTAKFKVGNQTFHHPVRIETIKPNRLKINISTPEFIQADRKNRIGLDAHWLTGPAARNMAATMDMTLYVNPTPFEKFKSYTFKNPLVEARTTERSLFTCRLDSAGHKAYDCTIPGDSESPGMLTANLTAKVTEPGGDASMTSKSVAFSPFGVYVGIDLGAETFETDSEIKFPVVALNQVGSLMKSRELEYKIYKLDMDWWWECSSSDLSRYVRSTGAEVVARGSITVSKGRGELPFKVEYPERGRYLVLVRDTGGGHATGGVVTVDWPQWRGLSDSRGGAGSTELSFTLDRGQYEVGETAVVYLPKCRGGRVLLSVETGSRIVNKVWVDLSGDKETKYPLHIEKSMAPNFYVSATMLRPLSETDFDTPIRLFGVRSVKVIDPQSVLHPEITMPDELHPRDAFTIRVSERDRKPMTYTLAIVDEGLLDITNYKTPRPWPAMNRKEALGVKTWDMFDDVIGSFGSDFRSIMSIGGDEALRKSAGKEKRFNPAVRFLGPFTTGGTPQTHRITLPNYVGSVRVMVVAGQGGAYGNVDKTVKVTSPLMLLSSLPASLANCDTVSVPVNVFAMQSSIRDVSVSIDASGPLQVIGGKTRSLSFSGGGEQLTYFRIACSPTAEGKGRIILTASGNGHSSVDTTFIDIFNPMPTIIETTGRTVEAGSTTEFLRTPRRGAKASLQIASLPMPNFGAMAEFMDGYRHLCSEQLSSKALFMLYGRHFLDEAQAQRSANGLPRVLRVLQSRRTPAGGFIYWPGQTDENEWVTSMAGLALTEAVRQGYRVDPEAVENWTKYQEKKARDYKFSPQTDLEQAFRLYTLASAGHPQTAAMNRLRESKTLSCTAVYCLASAYAEAGRTDVGLKLIERAEQAESGVAGDMFYSALRNSAIELEAYALCGQNQKAMAIARRLAAGCSGAAFVTQDLAFATIALNHLARKVGVGKINVEVAESGCKPKSISDRAWLRELSLAEGAERIAVSNLCDEGSLELSLMEAYRPGADETVKSAAKGMKMSISYVDLKGKPVSIANLKQDSEFKVRITVTNLSRDSENMALSYAIPSGWEIWNGRLQNSPGANCDNCDIRDSAALYYFALPRGASKTVYLRLRATYPGSYLLPPTTCEDMYDPGCYARVSGRRVRVTI